MGVKAFINKVFSRSASSSLIFNTGSLAVFSEINSSKAIRNGFNSNAAVYSIVMTDAEKFATITRYLYDANVKEEKAAATAIYSGSTDLTNLLNRPNPEESQDAWLAKVRAYYKVTGEAFIWLNRGDTSLSIDTQGELFEPNDEQVSKMPVLEMYALPSDQMLVVPDPDNLWGVSDYILNSGGKFIRLGKMNVVHWKCTNLDFAPYTRTHLRGRSPLSSGYKVLQQNEDATNSAVRMYQNDGAKGVLTNETINSMTPEQQTELKRIIDSKINNNDVKGAVAAIQGKWNYFSLGSSSVDMQLLEGKEMSWKELCFLFGVPFEFFDSKTTFANKEQAQNGWVSNKIIPACKQFDGELNRVLLKAFGLEKLAFIGSDFSDLLEAQRDLALLVTALATAWWLTPNEKRSEMGQDERTEPEMDEIWPPSGIAPMSQMNDQAQMDQVAQELAKRGM